MNKNDERGRVKVSVLLVEGGAHVKGNASRSLTLQNATVSEVMAAIAELFSV